MMDVETGPSVIVVAAGLTVDRHRNGLRCPHCTSGGCPLLAEARRTLDVYRAARRERWSS